VLKGGGLVEDADEDTDSDPDSDFETPVPRQVKAKAKVEAEVEAEVERAPDSRKSLRMTTGGVSKRVRLVAGRPAETQGRAPGPPACEISAPLHSHPDAPRPSLAI
jgi:hypothetical protein